MKKLLIIIGLLVIIVIAGFVWWTKNSERLITDKIQETAGEFFVNTENIEISYNKISIKNWSTAFIDNITISGTNLELKGGGRVKNANIILNGVHISMPPVRLTDIDSGEYLISLSTDDINSYLRAKKGVTLLDGMIPVSSIRFAPGTKNSIFSGVVEVPIISTKIPWKVNGNIVKSENGEGIDFVPKSADISKVKISATVLMKAIANINPIVDVSSWPVDMNIQKITPSESGIEFSGKLINFKDGMLFR